MNSNLPDLPDLAVKLQPLNPPISLSEIAYEWLHRDRKKRNNADPFSQEMA